MTQVQELLTKGHNRRTTLENWGIAGRKTQNQTVRLIWRVIQRRNSLVRITYLADLGDTRRAVERKAVLRLKLRLRICTQLANCTFTALDCA